MPVSGLLLDLDGVLYIGSTLIPGARETLAWLHQHGIPVRFITNTTTQTPMQLVRKLHGFGIDAREDEVFSAVSATVAYLRQQGKPRCHLLVADAVKPCFAEFPVDTQRPDYVVIGDIGNAWNYTLLNDAFMMLMRGARLLCLHRNKYWQTEDGLCMDIGAFVTALEYASGTVARVIGKPALTYFDMAVNSLAVPAAEVAIVGDDIDSDIGGGQAAGLQGMLVQTGKYRTELAARSQVTPEYLLPSIAELPALLTQIRAGI
ncbi:MAG TPA: TIGR01458 family HAD-type hydrolase [Candidatus Acidoferrum sp.]|nr:TIGR01458 family HAD-type hydrolase [Candidatus Acidoferrum sp.]